MIKTLYNIGKVLEQQDEYADYFNPWQNPFPKNADKAKVIVVEIINGEMQHYTTEDFKSGLTAKYLYRKPPGSNGTNLVPTFTIYATGKPIEDLDNLKKTLKKVAACIKTYKHTFLTQKHIDSLLPLLQPISFNKDNKYLLTFKVDGKWMGEFEEYVELFMENSYNKYYTQESKGTSQGFNKVCSVTYQQVPEVWGFVDTLGFTVNDDTFLRNGFDKANAYKMFPVSPQAVKILDGMKAILLEKFAQNFAGMKYFVLPHFINPNNEALDEAITFFANKLINPFANDSTGEDSIVSKETFLHEIAEEYGLHKNEMYLDFFFWQQNQSQIQIKLQLHDVLPSQLQKVFRAKKAIEARYRPICEIRNKKGEVAVSLLVTFWTIKNYFIANDMPTQLFFKIMEAVFYGTAINEQEILKAFFAKIQAAFKNISNDKYSYIIHTKETFALYQFFLQLNLFKSKPYTMSTPENTTVELTLDGFIEQHPHFFGSEYKKGVFKLACLTEILLAKQRTEIDNDPFLKKLNGLSIEEKEIQSILPQLISKLGEYKVSWTNKLETEIAQLLVNRCELNRTEISFTFALGLIMQKEFTRVYHENNKKQKEENDKKQKADQQK